MKESIKEQLLRTVVERSYPGKSCTFRRWLKKELGYTVPNKAGMLCAQVIVSQIGKPEEQESCVAYYWAGKAILLPEYLARITQEREVMEQIAC